MRAACFGLLLALGFAMPAPAAPVNIVLIGQITQVTGPEPVGGVSLGDSFSFDIRYESTAISGVGEETIAFDGLTLLDASLLLTLGTDVFDETSTHQGVSFLDFRNGKLVGYNYRGVAFFPPSGAQYFLTLEDGVFSQQFSFLPFGVTETRVHGAAPVPEPGTAGLVAIGLSLLALRSPIRSR